MQFINVLDPDNPRSFLYHSGTSCGGVAIGDVDADGRPDLYLVSGSGKNRLYRQVGDLAFEDVTKLAGVDGGDNWGSGTAMVDIDNDGDLDIYVCNYDAPNQLFVNDGKGVFRERAEAFGVDIVDASLMPAFCDYDHDGDLDLYLLTNRLHDPDGNPSRRAYISKNGKPEILPEKKKFWKIWYRPRPNAGEQFTGRSERLLGSHLFAGRWSVNNIDPVGQGLAAIWFLNRHMFMFDSTGRPDRLLRHNGNGTFSDVTEQAGITSQGDGLSATWWDYNDDGWDDVYVGSDFLNPDYLFHNNGDGTFTDVINEVVPHTSWFSMGSDAADINNDGLLDFISADMSATTHYMQKTAMGDMNKLKWALETAQPRQYMRNAFYVNSGTKRFMEMAYLTGLASTNWTWSVKFGDLDNDGWIDLYVTNGVARNTIDSDHTLDHEQLVGRHMWDQFRLMPPRLEQNLAYQNRGDFRFVDVSKNWGLDHLGMSYAAALSDLDRDGDLDLVVVNLDETVTIYRNQSTDGHRVLIRLVGVRSNRYGIGAKVTVRTRSGMQVRQLKAAAGFMASDEPLVHIGLGEDDRIDQLSVRWPSGHTQHLQDLPADRFYTITEPTQTPIPSAIKPKLALFNKSSAFEWVEHIEKPYNDYQRQPLLPQKLSQLGPGMAWADVDGDGDDDAYIGGAAGQTGMLCLNEGGEHFRWGPLHPFDVDKESEDMAPLFFDADGDGDLDLYVVSGSVECEAADPVLRDRLYLNDGGGNFTVASPDALPDLRDSGSVVAAADFDRDGDLDLFVGSRSIPGQYPLAPQSHLLRNEQGRFTDVSAAVAPALGRTGLVTSAIWSDADGDGWLDLLVTHEWGPVKLYRNHQGQLKDSTQKAGLASRRGWWNGIAAADIDNDGDIDYAVTNFGLNTKYHATPQDPALTYYGDLDGTGNMRIAEAIQEDQTLVPVRGKSCSQNACPFVSEKFPLYHDFASASLTDIYTEQRLANALRLDANTLESGILINDGQGRFMFHALPRLAQVSPGFGVVLTEVDGDGFSDLYLVQNLFAPQPETGHMDGGLSVLLTGNGDGTFTPVWPDRSGLVVHADAKSLSAVDLNEDGWVDFVVGLNDGQVQAFRNHTDNGNRMVRLRLLGPPGNPTAVGARVTLQLKDGPTQTAEVYAGGSYLSQSSNTLRFGLGQDGGVREIEVRWPDGQVTRMSPPSGQDSLTLKHPGYRDTENNGNKIVTAHESPEHAAAHLELAGARVRQGKFDAAVRQYRRALQLQPDLGQAHHGLGVAHAKKGQLDQAIRHFRQALKLRPQDSEVRNELGNVLQMEGQIDEAIHHYQQALATTPDDAELHYNLGVALQSQGDHQRAIAHYGQALQVNPQYAFSHYKLARALESEGQLTEAVSHYRLVLQVNPDHFVAHSRLGELLHTNGTLDEAIRHYRQAIRIKPDDAPAHNNLGLAVHSQGQIDEAISHFQAAVRADPKFADGHFNLGNALATDGRADEAISHFQAAVRADPKFAAAHYNLGNSLAIERRFDEAIGHYRQVLQFRPDAPNAVYNLGRALQASGRSDEAIHSYRETIRIEPNHAAAHFKLGNALAARGAADEALAPLGEALRLMPDYPAALNLMAWILATHPDAAVRDAAAAIEHAQRAARLTDNQNPPILDTLAAAYAAAGRFDDAVSTAQTAMELTTAARDELLTEEFRHRLDLYRQERPYREPRPMPEAEAR